MIEFPKTAAFGRRITVAQLKKQGLKSSFAETVKTLTWSYKLSPETMQLAPTETVKEIEVMDLVLKERGTAARTMAALISAIDGFIPSPLLFRVYDETGEDLGLMFNLKASGGALHGTSEVFRLFQTKENVPLPTGVTSLFQGIGRSVCGNDAARRGDPAGARRPALSAGVVPRRLPGG